MTTVSIRGASARLIVAYPLQGLTETARATVVREGGQWKISEPPARSMVGRDIVYRVPSPSMLPTLIVGETVLVDPSRYSSRSPSVGDIIVFHPPAGADPVTPSCGHPDQGGGHPALCSPTPQESSQTFIKRVVAGPGDTISMRDGHVIRNGVEKQDSNYTEPCGTDPSCTFRTPVTIPAGDYFVLGDNRGASDDSRFWGPIPKAWIIGLVVRQLR